MNLSGSPWSRGFTTCGSGSEEFGLDRCDVDAEDSFEESS